jgi:hypothetical protein
MKFYEWKKLKIKSVLGDGFDHFRLSCKFRALWQPHILLLINNIKDTY